MLVIVKDNLEEMCNKYVNHIVKIYDVWVDKDSNQEYATIDLCVEIPVQCLKYLNR